KVNGDGTLYSAQVIDTLPADTTFVSSDFDPDATDVTDGVVTWNLGDITAEGDGTIRLVVSLDSYDPWADSVVSYDPGKQLGGGNLPSDRNQPDEALGEDTDTDAAPPNFVSLGFGGELVLGFDNYIINGDGDDVHVIETSYGNPSPDSYPEAVEVFASQTGTAWVSLGTQVRNESDKHDNDFDLGTLSWARYIKLVDKTSKDFKGFPEDADGYDVAAVQALHSAPSECELTNSATFRGYTERQYPEIADVVAPDDDELSVSDDVTITINEFACELPEQPVVTIVAHKIICDSEDLLPDWGTGEYAPITATTAQEFVDKNKGCRFADDDWKFEWAPQGAANPGDALIGPAEGWNSSDPTVDGKTTITLTDEELGDNSYVWIREVLQEGYVPFSGWTSNGSNVPTEEEAFSAELYATTDVLNYDNYDRVEADGGLQLGQTYYAVAFNVLAENPNHTLTGTKFNDVNGDGRRGDNEIGLEGWTIKAVLPNLIWEDAIVDSSDINGWRSLDPLNPGQYMLVANGTWLGAGENNPGAQVDAEYTTQDAWTTHTDGTAGYPGAGIDQGDLMVNGEFLDWGPYNGSDHTYYANITLERYQEVFLQVFDGDADTHTPIPGWYADNIGQLTVDIYQVVDEAVTNANGDYELEIPAATDHVLVYEIPQRGWTQTRPSDPNYYDIYTDQDELTGLDFGNHGEDIPGTVTGMKFNDFDGNGIKDGNDSGLARWTIYAGQLVEEFDVDSHNDDPLWHEDSNNDGKSKFSTTLEDQAEYIIRATGTFDANDGITADAQYSKRLFADDPEAWTDKVDGYGGYGERLLDLWIGSAYGLWGDFSPSHVYWHTFVGNGNQAEFHIHDICAENNSGSLHVEIYKVVAKGVTDESGEYQLDIPAEINDDLIIAEETKTGWAQTYPDPSVKEYYTVSADVLTGDIDFGNHDTTIPEPKGSIAGIKFNDHNGNGTKDGTDDEVLSGWTIYIDANDNGALDPGEKSDVTDETGAYDFADLAAGPYIVREAGQSGWTQTHPVAPTGGPAAYSLLVGSGDGAQWNWTDIDFGNHQGSVDQQGTPGGGITGGSSGGGYYTPPVEQVLGDQITNPTLALNEPAGNEAVGGEQLPAAGTPTFIVMSLAALTSLIASGFTYRRKKSQFEE
ncbi:MAG: SdrD B-like domain-containing protein, partial [Patescibacteria group bacterium]